MTPDQIDLARRLVARLPERFRWTLHNLVAHPLSEVLYQVGLHRWSDIVHDCTVPAHKPDGFARRVTP